MTILFIDGQNFKGQIGKVFELEGKEKPVWHTYRFNG
jgi:hypothetical protein